jgi:hypothetical protein
VTGLEQLPHQSSDEFGEDDLHLVNATDSVPHSLTLLMLGRRLRHADDLPNDHTIQQFVGDGKVPKQRVVASGHLGFSIGKLRDPAFQAALNKLPTLVVVKGKVAPEAFGQSCELAVA